MIRGRKQAIKIIVLLAICYMYKYVMCGLPKVNRNKKAIQYENSYRWKRDGGL